MLRKRAPNGSKLSTNGVVDHKMGRGQRPNWKKTPNTTEKFHNYFWGVEDELINLTLSKVVELKGKKEPILTGEGTY